MLKQVMVLLMMITVIFAFSGAASAASDSDCKKVLVTPAYDEQVLVKAAYDETIPGTPEQIIHHDAVYETVHHDAVYETVETGKTHITGYSDKNSKQDAYDKIIVWGDKHWGAGNYIGPEDFHIVGKPYNGHWKISQTEQKLVKEAYDEQVLVKEAYDEIIPATPDKIVHHEAEYKTVHHEAVYKCEPIPPAATEPTEPTEVSNEIPMQHTGAPILPLGLALLTILGGIGYARFRN